MSSNDEIVRYLKLESLWILINISYTESDEQLLEIFNPQYMISHYLQNLMLGDDFQMMDQVWYLLSNVILSGDDLVKIILKNFKLMDSVTILYDKHKMVPNYLTI